jgi:hypothetical protein
MNLVTAAVTNFEPAEEHTFLARFAGTWAGATRTWIEPGGPPDESRSEAEGEVILGGRFVRFEYSGMCMGHPHAGQFLLAYERDEGRHTVVWIDSFHMGTGVMVCPGQRDENGLTVSGTYPVQGHPRWGWRTRFRFDGGTLVVEAWNISPEGEEWPAVETRYTRA